MRAKTVPLLLLAAAALLAGCARQSETAPAGDPTIRSGVSDGLAACAYAVSGSPARPVDPPPTKDVPATGTTTATLTTDEGPITIALDLARTPCTANSFLSLAGQGFYTGTRCHRLTDSGGLYILQCGDPTGTGGGGPGYSFADEVYADDAYPAGTVAMANAGPDTNGSQFFLVYEDSQLPPDYTVFGHMDEASLAVVRRIAANGRDGSSHPNNPAEIERVSVG